MSYSNVKIESSNIWKFPHEERLENARDNVMGVVDEKRLVRKIDWRFIPAAMVISLASFLDRSNIGNARILNESSGHSITQTLHLTNAQFRVALLIFLVSYTTFGVPSNYMLKYFRPSRWIAILMLGWGLSTIILSQVKSFAGLVIMRVLLGAFEAGLFPGLIYCLTFWYKPEERTFRAALIAASNTIGGAFGGAIAFGIGHMDGIRGLQAWRWLFILEGIPSCICAILVYAFFPDFPETAPWLSNEERLSAISRLQGLRSMGHERITLEATKRTLTDWRLYLHYLSFLSISVPVSSISLFTPTIVSGLGFDGLAAQLFTIPPYAIAFVVAVSLAWLTDRYHTPSLTACLCLAIAGIAFIIQGALPAHAFKARYALLCVAAPFTFAATPPSLSWLTTNLRDTSAATLAVALNISIGQAAQLIGVYIYKDSEAPRYPTGYFTNAAFLFLGSAAVFALRLIYAGRNRTLSPDQRRWQL